MFIPLTKVDEDKRLVYGIATAEIPDKAGEICDYATTKPYYEKWSSEISKASDGKSLGNLRSMHSKISSGKLIGIDFEDDQREIRVCAKVVDDQEWQKVLEGVYTGFSHGGGYVKRWKDPDNSRYTRYTANIAELSLVDSPCLSKATFEVVKMDGTHEMRKFTQPTEDDLEQDLEDMLMLVSQEVALEKLGTTDRWDECLEDAERGLSETFLKYSDEQPRDDKGRWATAAVGAALGGAKGAVLGALTAGAPGAVIGGTVGAVTGAMETSESKTVRTAGEIISAATSIVGVGTIAGRAFGARVATADRLKALAGVSVNADNVVSSAADAARDAQSSFDAALTRQKEKMTSDTKAAAARSKLRAVDGGKKSEKIMSIKNEDVLAKAVEMAREAGDESRSGDYIAAAREALEKSTTSAAAEPPVEKTAPPQAAEPPVLQQEDWGVSQVWLAKDGTTHIKKSDALAVNEKLKLGADPILAKLDAALGEKTVEPHPLAKWLGEEAWDATRAIEALNIVFGLVSKEVSEQEKSPEQVAALNRAIEGLKSFIMSEIAEDNSETMVVTRVAEALAGLAELQKSGARNSAADLEILQKIHDHSCTLGAGCGSAEKSAPTEDMEKIVAEHSSLVKFRDEIGPKVNKLLEKINSQDAVISEQIEKIEKMSRQPVEPPKLRIVEKGGDVSFASSNKEAARSITETFEKLSNEEKALTLVKISQQAPMRAR